MAYFRPMYRRRAPARKYQTRPRSSVYKKVVKPARQAIPAMARTFNRLKRKVLSGDEVVQYNDVINDPVGNLAGNNAYYRPLAQFGSWVRCFGTDSSDETVQQAVWRKTNIDLEIQARDEYAAIDYSIYIVQLTKIGAATLLNYATGSLNGPLVSGTHYVTGGTAGQVFLNPKFFKVLKAKRLMTGSNHLPFETASLRKRFYMKFAWNKGKGKYIKNPAGDWKSTPCPVSYANNPFILCFNNDSTADASVYLRAAILHTIEV